MDVNYLRSFQSEEYVDDSQPVASRVISLAKDMFCNRYNRRWNNHGRLCSVYVISAQDQTSVRHAFVVGDRRVPAYERPISGGAVVAAVRRTHALTVRAARRLVCTLSLQERPQIQEASVDERKRKRRRYRKYISRASRGIQWRSYFGARCRRYRLYLRRHVFPVHESAERPTATADAVGRLDWRQRLSAEKVQRRYRRGAAEKPANGSEACILNNPPWFLSNGGFKNK